MAMLFFIPGLARSVRFADMPSPPRERRKKKRLVKKTKAITPLQAMMLRMAGNVLVRDQICFNKVPHKDMYKMYFRLMTLMVKTASSHANER